MTLCPPPAQRWLGCAGLVAAAAGVWVAAPGLSVLGLAAPAGLDAPAAVRTMALQPAPSALAPSAVPPPALVPGLPPASLGAAPATTSSPVQVAVATSQPAPAPAGRNPFRPLLSAEGVPAAAAPDAGTGAGFALLRVLGPGDTGVDVRQVQSSLVAGGRELAVDGVYGSRTTASVTDFQRAEGLAPDGLVGPQTWLALRSGS